MTKKTTIFLPLILIFLYVGKFYGQQQSVVNGVSWFDTAGNRIQAHGASILKHDGVYYMLGADLSNGFYTVGFNLYSSTDLTNWTFLNTVVDENTNQQLKDGDRITLRPNLIYNEKTNKFVIWATYKNKSLSLGEVAIFTSNTVDGDYTFVKAFHPLGYDSNDSGMFVDDDGSAYYVSNSKDTKALNLYKLTDDYMDVTGTPTVLFPGKNIGREAPVLFKRNGTYYLLSSAKSGWDPNAGQYATSSSITGGWSSLKTFGNRITYDTQPTQVVAVQGSQGTSYFYLGDRWQDPGLRASKNILLPLKFDGSGNMSMDYVHEFKIDMEAGTWQKFDDNNYVPNNNWSLVSVSSQQNDGQYGAKNLFDNDLSTIWNSNFSDGNANYPYEIVINLGRNYDVSGFMLEPRQDYNPNTISGFQVFLSSDGNNWGKPVASGSLSYWSELYFPQQSAHYVKFVAKSELRGSRFASASELRLMSNTANYISSDLRPYYNLDGTGWKTATEVEMKKGSSIQFGPQAATKNGGQTQFYGTWSWYGPNGFYSKKRGVKVSNIQGNQFGDYTVYYLDDKFNVQSETITLKEEGALSVNDNNLTKDTSLALYPNPSENLVHIKNATTRTPYKVYDISGKEIMEKTGNTMDVSSLTKGVYLVRIKNKTYKLIRK